MINLERLQSNSKRFLNSIKNELGSDIDILMTVVDLSDPMNPVKRNKSYSFKAIVKSDEDAYNDRDTTANKEYKICSISIEDIEKKNLEEGANIPTPPQSLKKTEGLQISIDNGSNFQITTEKVNGFKQFYELRIERDY